MSGLLIKDIEVVKSIDKDIEKYSLIIPASIKRMEIFLLQVPL